MRVIDVSTTLENGMWSYQALVPAITPYQIERIASVEEDGWEVSTIHMTAVTGTYIEAPAHVVPGGKNIDEVPPERFVLDAVVLQLGDKNASEPITLEELEALKADIHQGDALILATGYDRMRDREDFVESSPYIEPEAMRWIVAKGVSLLALDFPLADNFRSPAGITKWLFEADALLMALLTNLREVSRQRVRFIALPLKLKGTSAAPCRALIIEE
jgi:kynurenine formamidase